MSALDIQAGGTHYKDCAIQPIEFPPSHGAVQSGHSLDFLPTAAHMPQAQAGRAGNRTGQGYMALQAILTARQKSGG